jgi:bacterioferritin (cytochrome b1)
MPQAVLGPSRHIHSLRHSYEGHVDWLESQVHQIAEIGNERYLITQTEEH